MTDSQKPTSRARTAAAKRYVTNAERLAGLIGVVNRAWEPFTARMSSIEPRVATSTPGDEVDKELDHLARMAEATGATVSFAFEWYLVMIVTFAEAYLEDVLSDCAKLDESLMGGSDQKASFDDIKHVATLDELGDTLRHRWARNFVDDGGPRRWSERIAKMGAPTLDSAVLAEVEELWGIRHVVVHRAGLATIDFCRRHPRLGMKAGDSFKLSSAFVLNKVEAVAKLVGWVDAYFLSRRPALDVVRST